MTVNLSEAVIEEDIPLEGLHEALRAFSGRGELLSVLATLATESSLLNREWSKEEVEARAHRILFEHLKESVARWPTRTDEWLDRLPIELRPRKESRSQPGAGTLWAETRRLGKWPPTAFRVRERFRLSDEVAMNALAWTIRKLDIIRSDAVRLAPESDSSLLGQLNVAEQLLDLPEVAQSGKIIPDWSDLRAIRREGAPWIAVADTCAAILRSQKNLTNLADELLLPDPALRGLLFHLAALGVTLITAKAAGYSVMANAPLGAGVSKPNFLMTSQAGQTFHLWFEGGRAWRFYGLISPYTRVTGGLPGKLSSISPDLLIVAPGKWAMSVECKYSTSPSYLRSGVAEALAYAADLSGILVPLVDSVVLVPSSIGSLNFSAGLLGGTLSLHTPDWYTDALSKILSSY